ncbi:MAG: Flp pilus assembly complex ATPase component TadA [Betaproteobacteria bacterium]|nr:Flp pilus assembly complex ATPase component TadA [Betaproteobacteria bacterium]MBU6511186.1 Flp pilus assembly complex ATPase component TadA [Betaproteobacteria bacterium]MDE1955129.1 Flp pilus assembly complex ATPase component TadA [Betaproteobacteria bacterium]MDE2151516.1 Flp pilus assembly complex ATPase component TadA [Betaproteobacteria bacterium]
MAPRTTSLTPPDSPGDPQQAAARAAARPGSAAGQRARLQGALDWQTVLQALFEDGWIDEAALRRGLDRCAHGSARQHALQRVAAATLPRKADGKLLDLDALSAWLAERAGLPLLRIDPLKVDIGRIGDLLSRHYAERHRILPVSADAQGATIATAEPFETGWLPEVERMLRRPVQLVVANPADIARYTAEFFNLARSVREAQRNGAIPASGANQFEQLVEMGRSGRAIDANDAGIVQVVDWLWQYAFEQRASDMHLEPRREFGVIRFRIDGLLHVVYQVPPSVMNAMTSRIKLLGRMDVVERRRPQDGRIKTRRPDGEEVELRLSTLPTAFGEKLVMRVFDRDVVLRDLSALGFPAAESARWEELTSRPHGIVLVTGPTGSGKTTTLYSTLKRLATDEVNVCTVEDPIEMVEPAFNQMQVQSGIELGFADGLRALMRQDPDIIMVGEIRDRETADMAVQAALTGHLVLSTLHTNDAAGAITRLLELGVPPYLLGATLLGVLAQRLVRTLCVHCRQPDAAFDQAAFEAAVAPWKPNAQGRPCRAVGCLECRNTGYLGRVGLYELLPVGAAQRALIAGGAALDALRAQAVRDGMRPLRLAGALKVAEGVTTLEEILRATPAPQG